MPPRPLTLVPTFDEPGPPPGEAELFARAAAGDDAAFEQLYEEHQPAVRRFLRDLLRDEALADEAAQETFARALVRLPALKLHTRLLAWLLGVARNVSLEVRRDALRAASPVGLHVVDADGEEREPADDAFSPEELLLGREAQARLSAALEELSEDRRAVLLLRADHELACSEIATLMGWSVAKVKVEVHRARLQLRELLGRRKEGEA